MTHLQSSDDFGILISVQLKDLTPMKVELTNLRIETLLKSRENTMAFWCARSSYEKSTIGAHADIFEFNSDWHVKNSILRPIIKYSIVSLQSTTQIRREGRLTQFSNQRAQKWCNYTISCSCTGSSIFRLPRYVWPVVKTQSCSRILQ